MDQVSNPYKKTGDITDPYILIIASIHKRKNEANCSAFFPASRLIDSVANIR
jgi:hypothetical protein